MILQKRIKDVCRFLLFRSTVAAFLRGQDYPARPILSERTEKVPVRR